MNGSVFGPDMVPIKHVGKYLEEQSNKDSYVGRVLEPREKRNMSLIKQMQEYGMPEEIFEEARDAEAQSTDAVMCLVDELIWTDDYVISRQMVDLILRYCEEASLRELIQLLQELFAPDVQA